LPAFISTLLKPREYPPFLYYVIIYFQKIVPGSNARYLFITPITTYITSIVMCHCAKGSCGSEGSTKEVNGL
jgi:hypothetical protein